MSDLRLVRPHEVLIHDRLPTWRIIWTLSGRTLPQMACTQEYDSHHSAWSVDGNIRQVCGLADPTGERIMLGITVRLGMPRAEIRELTEPK